MKQPKVLSIAGFDSSAGAGTLADIKVFQHFNVYGFGVISAITIQNEYEIRNIHWLTQEEIKSQLEVVFDVHSISVVKIGIIQNIDMLSWLIKLLRSYNPSLKIVWDPILKSSSGFRFWDNGASHKLFEIMKLIDLITPNREEFNELWGNDFSPSQISHRPVILLKSAIETEEMIIDHLFWKGETLSLRAKKIKGFDKHGTGCVLSSGITAGLALGLDVKQAYHRAKKLLSQYRSSSESLLGII
ncbi:hydroxymethylpyrimidine/phosphomethylpyrimidine kinase [Mesonia maritima]|uniref:hydroxymethylpyrimidine kinase n=1 Tax=Mesonia maritima TaxID=1793873 RepID=A0ABU1K8R7_9FLAO|nr:hydroxymethylpyrimidine/phosphomethylpyrimidine kinase [Mesonia maritima]MDR6300973.1 hydroxymethylpyrimidine/phosphomethylpyrimidine kinase [Mesonia maritima]